MHRFTVRLKELRHQRPHALFAGNHAGRLCFEFRKPERIAVFPFGDVKAGGFADLSQFLKIPQNRSFLRPVRCDAAFERNRATSHEIEQNADLTCGRGRRVARLPGLP